MTMPGIVVNTMPGIVGTSYKVWDPLCVGEQRGIDGIA